MQAQKKAGRKAQPLRPAFQQQPFPPSQSSILIRLHHRSSCSTITSNSEEDPACYCNTQHINKNIHQFINLPSSIYHQLHPIYHQHRPTKHLHNIYHPSTINHRPIQHIHIIYLPFITHHSSFITQHSALIIHHSSLPSISSSSISRTTMPRDPCALFLFFFKKNPCRERQG
jgi:hypothetical protein